MRTLSDRASTLRPAARVPSSAQLAVVEGKGTGQKFRVDASATIGRSPEASVMLDDPEVSRLHARMTRSDAGYLLEDLGSRNGTFVNGTRIERRYLAYGDKIRVGTKILLELIGFDAVEDQLVQRQRFEAIGRLGVGIAHDLNNVLAALEAGAKYLHELPAERTLRDTEVRECISDLSLAVSRASELTRGILSFARGRGAERGPVDVSQLVTEVVRMLRHTLDQSIRLEQRIDPDVVVHGSQSELHQILLNLCLNARDAMPEGGVLRVTAAAVDGASLPRTAEGSRVVQITVEDSGVGIDAETQARIFEPFFSTKRDGAGYGLGLASVREIVLLHGGKVSVDSAPGRGSTFRVFLPMLDAQSLRLVATDEHRPLAKEPAFGSVSVLLVDDEQIVRRSVARLLRQAGFLVAEACDGAQAIAQYARDKHDLVLLDLDMPGLNGEETQIRLMNQDPEVRIVFASGHVDPKREAAVRARGALAFLQKPYGLNTLLEVVRDVLQNYGEAFSEVTRPR